VVIDLPAPGSYPFVCTIHDGMAGAIIVAGPSVDGGAGG
jgi:plastocyanin